jgi:hypothetical protein
VGDCVVGSDACHGFTASNRGFTRVHGLDESIFVKFARFVWRFSPYRTRTGPPDRPDIRR